MMYVTIKIRVLYHVSIQLVVLGKFNIKKKFITIYTNEIVIEIFKKIYIIFLSVSSILPIKDKK